MVKKIFLVLSIFFLLISLFRFFSTKQGFVSSEEFFSLIDNYDFSPQTFLDSWNDFSTVLRNLKTESIDIEDKLNSVLTTINPDYDFELSSFMKSILKIMSHILNANYFALALIPHLLRLIVTFTFFILQDVFNIIDILLKLMFPNLQHDIPI